MSNRSLLTGEWANELDIARTLVIKSKAPAKYMLVDLENGKVYRGTESGESSWQELPVDEAAFQLDTVRQDIGI